MGGLVIRGELGGSASGSERVAKGKDWIEQTLLLFSLHTFSSQ